MQREKQSGGSRNHRRGHGGAAFYCVSPAGGSVAGVAGDDPCAGNRKLRLYNTGAGGPAAGIAGLDPAPFEKFFFSLVVGGSDCDDLPTAPGACDAFLSGPQIACGGYHDKAGVPGGFHGLNELLVIFSFLQSADRDVENPGVILFSGGDDKLDAPEDVLTAAVSAAVQDFYRQQAAVRSDAPVTAAGEFSVSGQDPCHMGAMAVIVVAAGLPV